jgi:hypothetical protein
MGLEFRMSGFFDTRRLCQETLARISCPLPCVLSRSAAARSWRGESQRSQRYESGDLHILKMNGAFGIDTPAAREERVGGVNPT